MNQAQQATSRCDHPDCHLAGEFRAPKARDQLNEFYWFCLEHVREYNRGWNFCAGLDEKAVEREVRNDTVWRRPSWPLGASRGHTGHAKRYAEFQDDLGIFEDIIDNRDDEARRRAEQVHKNPKITKAMAIMQLTPPLTLTELKSRYKELVKRWHPDTNGGDKTAEDKLKTINEAYTVLKKTVHG